MKKFAVFAIAAVFAASAFAAAGWLGAGAININGTWYRADDNDGNAWAGEFFSAQTLDFGTASSFTLGGQVQLWDENSADWGQGTAWMYYSIDSAISAADLPADLEHDTTGSRVDLTYYKYDPNNNYFQSGGNSQDPDAFSTDTISLAGLDAGNHTLSVLFVDFDGRQPTATFTANFTTAGAAVPEPATMSLLGLGALAMVIRRKLRK